MALAQPEAVLPRFVGVEEMASILGISTPTLHRLLAEGQGPPHFRVGRKKIRFPIGGILDEWVRERASAQERGDVAVTTS